MDYFAETLPPHVIAEYCSNVIKASELESQMSDRAGVNFFTCFHFFPPKLQLSSSDAVPSDSLAAL